MTLWARIHRSPVYFQHNSPVVQSIDWYWATYLTNMSKVAGLKTPWHSCDIAKIIEEYLLKFNQIFPNSFCLCAPRQWLIFCEKYIHNCDVIMGAIASQITSLMIVYSIIYSDADQRKHQSSASLAFVWGIHLWPVNSSHKEPVTRKMFSFDDVIMHTFQNVAIKNIHWEVMVCKHFPHCWTFWGGKPPVTCGFSPQRVKRSFDFPVSTGDGLF